MPTGGPSGSSEPRWLRLDPFADQSLSDLLDAVAAQQPAPGGGSSSAWSGAFGAALVEMAANFTLARPKYAGVHHRMADVRRDAKALRRELLELGQRDAQDGYEPVLAAMRLPEKHPERERKLDEARSDASDVPLAVAEAAARVAELAAETARTGGLHLQGDSITGSLVDSAEEALRNWLAPGRHRTGDRLPPEHDLAAMLGVSRGTLRTALQRLEETGEMARRRGVELGVRDVEIERRPIGADVGALFGLPPDTEVAHVARVVLAGGEPAAYMTDVVHPDIVLPGEAGLRRAFERGEMILDVLLQQGVPIAFATTRVMPRLLTPRERVGQLFGVRRTTAALELEEIIHVTSGEVVHHSRDLFGPGGMDLHVVRGLDVERPAAVNPAAPHRPS